MLMSFSILYEFKAMKEKIEKSFNLLFKIKTKTTVFLAQKLNLFLKKQMRNYFKFTNFTNSGIYHFC